MLMLVVVGMMPTMLVVMICASVAIMVMVIGAVNVLLAVSLLHPSSCFQENCPCSHSSASSGQVLRSSHAQRRARQLACNVSFSSTKSKCALNPVGFGSPEGTYKILQYHTVEG